MDSLATGTTWWHGAPGVCIVISVRTTDTMNCQPYRPAVFCPAAGQRRWVRDRAAAIRGHRGWVHFVRVDEPHQVMVDAPYDHESVGEWERRCRSVWQCPAVGASFPSIAAAAAWVQQMPRV